MRSLSTIGYEGASMENFLATLRRCEVTTILDVRELPLSRRRGFSKRALAESLALVGISYRHERTLGSPKAVRQQLRDDGDYTRYFAAFGDYLKLQESLLEELAVELKGNVALLCYERDPATCHRRSVAERLAQIAGVKVRHLGVTDAPRNQRARPCIGQGLSAA